MKIAIDEEFDLDEELEFEKDDKKKVGVLFEVVQLAIDSTEYKILSPTLVPEQRLLVKLELEEDEIIEDTNGMMVITQNGFLKMLLRYAKLSKNYETGVKNG
jgi:hypothetical protein